MMTIPEEFSKQISVFAPMFSRKVFKHVQTLLMGSLLVVGRRTVCSALRAVGLEHEKQFHKFHRVLSKAKWSSHQGSRILLDVLVHVFIPSSEPLVFGIDETLERRWGSKIKARGIYRDAVRSSHSYFIKCSGLRWMCMMLLTPISWARRVWALPFLTVLAPSERYNQQQGKNHKKITDWARQMILQLKRWLPYRQLIVVADSSYASYSLLDAVRHHVCMITPLRLDARLFNTPPAQPAGKRGPKPKIGMRQPTLKQRIEDDTIDWWTIIIPQWYGQSNKVMQVATGTALWYKSNDPLVPLRWVLIKDSAEQIAPVALLCTDLELDAQSIINYFIRRWTVEVTLEESRRHLGVESQRQWSDLAIARTTPVLMGLFSMVTLWTHKLQQQQGIEAKSSAWYIKRYPTFSDAMALVRQQLWQAQEFSTSQFETEVKNLNEPLIRHLCNMMARAA
jgi:hypothetical protein